MPDSPPTIRVCFLWHMHQPYYKDLITGVYRLPWTRMHALKDYYGMVALLEEFPSIHATFNLVPSLLIQLQEYATGTANEPVQKIAYTPADELRMEDRVLALTTLFQANPEHLIARYPRYQELYQRYAATQFSPAQALPFFQTQDFADLQVLSQLAWFDEYAHEQDEVVRELARKGRGFTLEEQKKLYERQQALLRQIIPAYRRAAERGQVELSTSPFYHPILPLLCDTESAREPHPGVPLPRYRFTRPEDARTQLERALRLHTELFGSRPNGVWPSEGSVSPQVAEMCAALGFQWMATDQRILGHSLGTAFYRQGSGGMENAEMLYRPYRFASPAGEIGMFFRDQELADLIGFVYSRVAPQQAAEDFLRRIHQSAAPALARGRDVVIPVILDGENAWEYYPRSGREFLRALYGRLAADPRISCLTFSEALRAQPEQPTLARLATGSWIGANFDIWIGAPEDNQAWDLLHQAREYYDQHSLEVPPEKRTTAFEELLIAEGSDWCWWYGPEHSTANDADFDALFRAHVANVYRSLGGRPPDELAQPIAHVGRAFRYEPPAALICPTIDGRISSYFEWMGAGSFLPDLRATTMHGKPPLMREAHFGRDNGSFYLRLDFTETAGSPAILERLAGLVIHVTLRFPGHTTAVQVEMRATAGEGISAANWTCVLRAEGAELPRTKADAACRQALELRISLEQLSMPADSPFDFQVALWQENLPVESLPLDGWIHVPAQPVPAI